MLWSCLTLILNVRTLLPIVLCSEEAEKSEAIRGGAWAFFMVFLIIAGVCTCALGVEEADAGTNFPLGITVDLCLEFVMFSSLLADLRIIGVESPRCCYCTFAFLLKFGYLLMDLIWLKFWEELNIKSWLLFLPASFDETFISPENCFSLLSNCCKLSDSLINDSGEF